MEKNYYEILEINENASPEIVKKAYTTLAKKYHPDLQQGALKNECEEKLKLINEAYEVLSNEEKRKEYDAILLQDAIGKERMTEELINENMNLKDELHRIKNTTYTNSVPNYNTQHNPNQNIDNNYENQIRFNEELQRAKEKAYYDAYIQDLKNRGYKIRYKKTLKDYFKNFIALLITALIVFLILQIPFIKKLFYQMYQENELIKVVIDLFTSIF